MQDSQRNSAHRALRVARAIACVAMIYSSTAYATSKPAAKVSAPARPAASAKPAGGAGAHGATTAAHGPTAASHGITTGSPHGVTTAGAHPTTAGARPGAPGAGGAHPNTAMGHGAPAPRGSRDMRTANGGMVRTRANGSRAEFRHGDMTVHHGLNGNRRVSIERADHSRVFAERGGHGFVQHPYMFHGREFGHRTYFYHGRAYDRFYGRYPYRGGYLDVYAPRFYYAPGFYGWVYNPWAAPIAYAWGWSASPWVGFYGAYFTPLPVYPNAAFWLTDYLIATSLQAAYDAQAVAAVDASAALDDQTRKLVADEVQRQIALENSEAGQNAQSQDVDFGSSGIARMLSDNQPHVFVAGSDLDLVDASGQECAVSQGDILEVPQAPPADATAASALVLASKGGKECGKNDSVTVAFNDLQDMQNHMRETIDQGMGDLKDKQGQGGLPPAPASAKAAPVQTAFAAVAPPPDPNASTEIQQQAQQADTDEQAAGAPVDAAAPAGAEQPVAPSAAPAAPVNIALGQTTDQVTGALGQPKRVIDLGTKKIYVYDDLKITFKAGKVSDVE